MCELQRPLVSNLQLANACSDTKALPVSPAEVLTTPVTSESLASLCQRIEQANHLSDDGDRQRVQKLIRAAKQFVAGRDILFVGNDYIRQQQDEASARKSIKPNVLSKANVMSWEDLEEMQKKRDAKEADQQERSRKRVCSVPTAAQHKQGLQNYCSVLLLMSLDPYIVGYVISDTNCVRGTAG